MQKRPRSDLDGLIRFWPNASGPEASQCAKFIRPCCWQNATSLPPGSQFQIQLCSSTDGLDHTVQNQAGFNLVLADCVRFWPNGSSLEASQFLLLQESSGLLLASASEPIQIGCKSDPACLLGWVTASGKGTVICVVVISE